MLSFLAKPIVSYIAVPVAILASVAAIWLAWDNRGLERDLAVERAAHAVTASNYRTCTGNVATLESTIARQNDAIDNLAAAGREMNARVVEALERVNRETAGLAEDAARLLELAEGPPPADACAAALNLIRGDL